MSPIDQIPELIEQGKKFTYEDFASKGSGGFPNALSTDWLVWTHEVTGILGEIDSGPVRSAIERGMNTKVLAYGSDKFQVAQASIVSGLEAARRIYGKKIPAADRVVSLGHNSPEQARALEKIDQLIEAVSQANDLPGEPDEKEQLLAELSASRKLLEASKVRLAALGATLRAPLRWITEKAAGTIVGKVATAVWDYFVGLHWL